MKKKRIMSLLIMLVWAISATTALAYDWSQMRGEVDVEVRHKDARGLDGKGGATKGFTERVIDLKLMPFEDSEFFVGAEVGVRDYEKSASGDGGDENTSYDFSIGNTYYTQVFGKTLTSRPVIGYKNVDREDDGGDDIDSKSYDSFYFRPQFTLSLNREWSVFTRGIIEYKKRDDGNSSRTLVTKVEAGPRYRWNRQHTSSASIFYRENGRNASSYGYSTEFYQLRVRHHWNLTRDFTLIPYVFIGLDGEQKRNGDSYTKGDEYDHNKYGIKLKYKASPTLTVHGGMAYETREDYSTQDGGTRKYYKRNVISHMGVKYAF